MAENSTKKSLKSWKTKEILTKTGQSLEAAKNHENHETHDGLEACISDVGLYFSHFTIFSLFATIWTNQFFMPQHFGKK